MLQNWKRICFFFTLSEFVWLPNDRVGSELNYTGCWSIRYQLFSSRFSKIIESSSEFDNQFYNGKIALCSQSTCHYDNCKGASDSIALVSVGYVSDCKFFFVFHPALRVLCTDFGRGSDLLSPYEQPLVTKELELFI